MARHDGHRERAAAVSRDLHAKRQAMLDLEVDGAAIDAAMRHQGRSRWRLFSPIQALGGIMLLAWLGCAIAAAAVIVTPEVQKSTYLFGIKCYVANGVAATDTRYNAGGDTIRTKAQKSYDVIYKMGHVIGYDDDAIKEDVDSYQNLMTKAFLRDDGFFQRVRSDCIKLGLM